MKAYSITFHDGSHIDSLTMNGDMFVSKTEIAVDSLNDESLKIVTIIESDGGKPTTTVLHDATCDGVLHWPEGWLFNIREKSGEEKAQAETASRLEEIDAALVELAELISEV